MHTLMAVPAVGCWPNANAANSSRPRAFFFFLCSRVIYWTSPHGAARDWHRAGMGLAWGWHGVVGMGPHGVGMGLAYGAAWGRIGLAWGRMGRLACPKATAAPPRGGPGVPRKRKEVLLAHICPVTSPTPRWVTARPRRPPRGGPGLSRSKISAPWGWGVQSRLEPHGAWGWHWHGPHGAAWGRTCSPQDPRNGVVWGALVFDG
jgi:hypothetical protein